MYFSKQIYIKLDLRGVRQPPGIAFKKKTFSRRSRKPPNPCPGSGTVAHVRRPRPGPGLRPVLWPWDRREDFFNLNLKFAPKRSRNQDMRSAAGFL